MLNRYDLKIPARLPVEPTTMEFNSTGEFVKFADVVDILNQIIDRSYNDPLGTSKVNDMRNIALRALGRGTK